MKTASQALITFLHSKSQMIVAELYEFNVKGSVIRYTSSDMDLSYGGNLYKKFNIERASIRNTVGLEVDELKIRLSPSINDTILPNGVNWVSAVRKGDLDGAVVALYRIFMPTWGDTSLGHITLFRGRISDPTDATRTEVNLTVKTELELLDTMLPRNMYQYGCGHNLYDQNCKANPTLFTQTGSATALSRTTVSTALTWAPNFFDLGTIFFLSGANNNVKRTIRDSGTPGSLLLALPTEFDINPGDSFSITAGCDKNLSTCINKFNNKINFRGFPFVPVPEAAA